jgi:DNA-binding transcriptional ArsR family regulator
VNKADLILHPARLQILLSLAGGAKTTQEISDDLVKLPKSSVYRHLKVLLAGGMIGVAETRTVRGVEERIYELIQVPHLNVGDVSQFSKEDYLRYFASFLANLLQGFADYLELSHPIDIFADRIGYAEVTITASTEELDQLQHQLQQVFSQINGQVTARNQRKQKFVLITYPLEAKGDENGHNE